jgi:hypothetical protein
MTYASKRDCLYTTRRLWAQVFPTMAQVGRTEAPFENIFGRSNSLCACDILDSAGIHALREFLQISVRVTKRPKRFEKVHVDL